MNEYDHEETDDNLNIFEIGRREKELLAKNLKGLMCDKPTEQNIQSAWKTLEMFERVKHTSLWGYDQRNLSLVSLCQKLRGEITQLDTLDQQTSKRLLFNFVEANFGQMAVRLVQGTLKVDNTTRHSPLAFIRNMLDAI